MLVPSEIANILPPEGIRFYEASFSNSFNRTGDEVLAHKTAWNLTKSRLKVVDGQIIANAIDFVEPQFYTFELEAAKDNLIIMNAGEELELNAVLATTEPRQTDGKYFTEVELEELARQINEFGSMLPDADHEELNRIKALLGPRPDMNRLVGMLREQKGVFKNIKAAVKEGKLWIQAYLDKRYKNYVNNSTHLSIEALAPSDAYGRLHHPKYLGFTFAESKAPQLRGAMIAR